MQQAIEKADTLIEALAWIRRFRDKTTVIKLGGSMLSDPEAIQSTLVDILFMESVGMRPVVVHGAGSRISTAIQAAGIEPKFVAGRRYTDAATLEIIEQVLARDTNQELAENFEKIGGRAMTLNFQSAPVLTGEQLKLTGEDGSDIDLGFVGQVSKVDRLVIDNLCYAGQVPFIPSMAETVDGQKLNVNADTAAMEVACALNAEKLIMLSDVPGVCLEKGNEDSLVSTLNAEKAAELIADGTISDGMIPKVQACLTTLERGVSKVHIIDGRKRHSLLLEIYTTSGAGTLIS